MLKSAMAQIVSMAAMKLTAYKKLSSQRTLLCNFEIFIVVSLLSNHYKYTSSLNNCLINE